jgi:hypothetical protein
MAAGDDGQYLLLVSLSALVVWVQASYDCDNHGGCTDGEGFAIAVGVTSFVITVVLYFVAALNGVKKFIYPVLAIAWVLEILVVTFSYKDGAQVGGYAQMGNGFVASWASCFLCVILTYIGFMGADPFASGEAGPGGEGAEADHTEGTKAAEGGASTPDVETNAAAQAQPVTTDESGKPDQAEDLSHEDESAKV